jgi:hypothetical protein
MVNIFKLLKSRGWEERDVYEAWWMKDVKCENPRQKIIWGRRKFSQHKNCPRARQPYRTENLHPPWRPITSRTTHEGLEHSTGLTTVSFEDCNDIIFSKCRKCLYWLSILFNYDWIELSGETNNTSLHARDPWIFIQPEDVVFYFRVFKAFYYLPARSNKVRQIMPRGPRSNLAQVMLYLPYNTWRYTIWKNADILNDREYKIYKKLCEFWSFRESVIEDSAHYTSHSILFWKVGLYNNRHFFFTRWDASLRKARIFHEDWEKWDVPFRYITLSLIAAFTVLTLCSIN